MYIPKPFAETDRARLFELIEAHAFGLLMSVEDGLPVGSHIPFVLDRASGENGTLQGHLARANPQWHGFDGRTEVLCVFQGPHAYVSPGWYDPANPAVPTWNYAAIHAYGVPRIIDDPAHLRAQQEALVARFEAGRADPWSLASQREDYIEGMLKGIVAFEIPLARLEGKFKLSQNQPEANRRGAIRGLRKEAGDPDSRAVAALMATREGID
ncbi:MAG TPA: FMN-binding negative transcriptional regulator [Alphaproteobacteria bacterium]|nr:FMN-binding negative transcriptional regulator [Alphaproteobacteria bacterium]